LLATVAAREAHFPRQAAAVPDSATNPGAAVLERLSFVLFAKRSLTAIWSSREFQLEGILQDRGRVGALGRRLGSDQLATDRHLEPAHRSVDRGDKDAEIRRNVGDGDSFDARTTKQPFRATC
jgi:hypothetical protein